MDRLADDVTTERARRAFAATLPVEVHGQCEILLFRDGELAIYVSQGAWASWLRNRRERILKALRDRRVPVSRLRLVVAPRAAVGEKRPVPAPPAPPPGAAGLVDATASTVSDPKLGEALRRLARRLAEKSG